MSLKDTFNDIAYELINETFADIAQTVTIQPTSAVYDVSLGELIDFDLDPVLATAIVGPFIDDRNEIDNVQTGDLRAVIAIKSLSESDREIFLQSDTYKIGSDSYIAINNLKDASESVFILQLRKQ